jgi:NitT/TauT family transport system substrate-binding protein
MKRRQFLKSTAALAGTAGLTLPQTSNAQAMPDVINVGHLVGICMSPLFYAQAAGLFKEEGLKVDMKFMPNPGDALTALTGGVMQVVHIPFTNIIVAANNGAPVRIIGGSGAGGLFLLAQGSSGIKSMKDLAAKKGTGLKIGAMRLNTFELMAYRALASAGLKYSDYNMVWFSDTLSMASAFEAKAVDVVTHVEPFATRLIDKLGGVPIASNLDTWGKDGPDCVTNARIDFLEKYPQAATRYMKALLKADAQIKANPAKAVDVLDASKFYRVDKETLRAALPRQRPQVNLIGSGEEGMRVAIADMTTLGYIKSVPANLIDFRFLKDALKA